MKTSTRNSFLTVTGLAATMALPLALLAVPAQAATEQERNDMLAWMIEEEKVAHDVYTTLGEKFNLTTFTNIARSEAKHQDAVRTLLDRYNLADPTVGNAVGEFENPELQKLYDDLVAQGSTSVAAAAQVGITIEEADIADLKEAIANDQSADVERVLTNLLNGSYRHLDAFTALADGETPSSAGMGQGKGHGQGKGQGQGRGQGMGRGR